MSEIPQDLYYTADHEWIRVDGDVATVGITAFAAESLGDIVYVQLPAAGEKLTAGEVFGEIESTKSVSELFAPVGGEVLEVNEAMAGTPEVVNSDPYGDGWLLRVRTTGEPPELLGATAYEVLLREG